jgi:hypothetical protein
VLADRNSCLSIWQSIGRTALIHVKAVKEGSVNVTWLSGGDNPRAGGHGRTEIAPRHLFVYGLGRFLIEVVMKSLLSCWASALRRSQSEHAPRPKIIRGARTIAEATTAARVAASSASSSAWRLCEGLAGSACRIIHTSPRPDHVSVGRAKASALAPQVGGYLRRRVARRQSGKLPAAAEEKCVGGRRRGRRDVRAQGWQRPHRSR